jgi:hypothetical protein
MSQKQKEQRRTAQRALAKQPSSRCLKRRKLRAAEAGLPRGFGRLLHGSEKIWCQRLQMPNKHGSNSTLSKVIVGHVIAPLINKCLSEALSLNQEDSQ